MEISEAMSSLNATLTPLWKFFAGHLETDAEHTLCTALSCQSRLACIAVRNEILPNTRVAG
jgi:hypothetical protein